MGNAEIQQSERIDRQEDGMIKAIWGLIKECFSLMRLEKALAEMVKERERRICKK